MNGALTRRVGTPQVSNDPMNRDLFYRFVGLQGTVNDHRWHSLRGNRYGLNNVDAHFYTGDVAYGAASVMPWRPRGNSTTLGSVYFNYTQLENYRVDNGATIAHGIGTGPFTLIAAIRPYSTPSANRTIWSNGVFAPALYQTRSTGKWGWYFGTAYVNATTLPTYTWVHLVATRIGSTLTFYLNGVQDGQRTDSGSMADAVHYIGHNTISAAQIDADVGEISLYKRGMPQGEVRAMYEDWRRGYERTINWSSLATKRSAEAAPVSFKAAWASNATQVTGVYAR